MSETGTGEDPGCDSRGGGGAASAAPAARDAGARETGITGITGTAASAGTAPTVAGVPRARLLAAGAVCAGSLGALAMVWLVFRFPMADVLVYRAEGRAVLRGADLYGFTVTEWDLPATYPPFAALLFVPFAVLSLPAAKAAFVLLNLALLVLFVHQSVRLAGRRPTVPLLLAGAAGALWLEPVFQSLVFGQINLLIACLVLWDLGRPDGAPGKGLAIGVAAGIKLTPAIFAVYLLLTGRVREALTALGAFAGTVLAGACVLPADSVEFWSRRIFETGRVGKAWIVDNQSLQGLVARALHVAEPGVLWLLPAALAGAGGLWLARQAYRRRGRERWGVLCTAFTALLVSPISWSHHWVWCVPLLAVLAVRAADARHRPGTAVPGLGAAALWSGAAAVAFVFTARTLWLVPKHGDLDLRLAWWQQPLASPYPLPALLLLAVAARRLYGRRAPRAGDGPAQTSSASAAGSSVASTMR